MNDPQPSYRTAWLFAVAATVNAAVAVVDLAQGGIGWTITFAVLAGVLYYSAWVEGRSVWVERYIDRRAHEWEAGQ